MVTIKDAKSYTGVMTALATPFDKSGGIDWRSFERLIEEQIKAGISGLIIHGTTGEAATLSLQEKLSLIKKAASLGRSHIKIMAGSGGMDTVQSAEFSFLCLEAGADSLLVVTPPYVKPNESGMRRHYEMIAERCKAPICLYHNPARTNQKLSLNLLQDLLKIPEITMVKEASADLSYFSQAASNSSAIFLTGDDPTFLASLAVGGQGCISVISNLFPKALVAMYQAFLAQDLQRALVIHRHLEEMANLIFCETNPTPLKFLLAKVGVGANYLRPPLGPISSANELRLAASYEKTRQRLEEMDLI